VLVVRPVSLERYCAHQSKNNRSSGKKNHLVESQALDWVISWLSSSQRKLGHAQRCLQYVTWQKIPKYIQGMMPKIRRPGAQVKVVPNYLGQRDFALLRRSYFAYFSSDC
jgi:hypothetical protein